MKKGFTLVEIILSIGLIVLIGTVSIVSFNAIKKNNVINLLNKMSEEIYNAVNLYVETNSEVKKELYNNANGIKIPLTTLENAGLVDFGKLNDEDIKDEFVVTMLGTTEEEDDHCANTYTAKSWDIKSGETIYICEKSNNAAYTIKEELINDSNNYYIAKGENPNNYVIFDVDTDLSEPVWFPEENQDLWRIVSIDSNNIIKLVYNNIIGNDNSMLFDLTTSYTYGSCTTYKYKTEFQDLVYSSSYNTYNYYANTYWSYQEVISKDDELKKQFLIDDIKNIHWLNDVNWNYEYDYYEDSGIRLNYNTKSEPMKLGTINSEEISNSILFHKTYIPTNNIILGGETSFTDKYIVTYLTLSSQLYCQRNYAAIFNGGNYLPAVVLKNEVTLHKNDACLSTTIQGSKECPYLLSCDNC